MAREHKEHHWFRVLYMILFWIMLRLSFLASVFIAVIQWVYVLFKNEPIEGLATFAASLLAFQTSALAYLTFQSEQKVFPFADWPKEQPK